MLTLFTLAQEVPPIDGAWLEYGPVWGTVGFLLLIVAGLVYSRVKGNGSSGKCKAAELGPVLQDLRGSIDHLADAVTEHRLATATGLTVLGTRTEQLARDLDAIQSTLATMSPRRRAAGK